MALINCPECTKEVSDQATKCPSCGKQLKKPQRSLIGKIFKWLFIIFNVLMAVWLIAGIGGNADLINNADSEAAQAGAVIGAGLGASIILGFWAIGDLILGLFVLFTRPKS